MWEGKAFKVGVATQALKMTPHDGLTRKTLLINLFVIQFRGSG